MNEESYNFVSRALRWLAGEVGLKDRDGSFWICYGSFVLNQQTADSDLDLLCIHKQPTSVRRIQSFFENYPVTIYSLSRYDFSSDGRLGTFGGYFGSKVLNPHVLFMASQKDMDMVLEIGGGFIAPFAAAMAKRQGRDFATSENLAADSVFARLHLCPWYRSYFLRYFISESFPLIWQTMTEVITLSLLKASAITQCEAGLRYRHAPSDDELHESTLAAVARFWALGSCLHGGMPDFPAYYMQKAERYVIDRNLQCRLEQMIQFLQAQAVVEKRDSNGS